MSTQVSAVRSGISIEWLSIVWMMIEAAVAIGAGLAAHALSLVAFGADSIIELMAAGVLLWRLYIEAQGGSQRRVKQAEKVASWVVGVALMLLGIYIVVAAVHELWTRQGAESSILGIGLAVASGALMPLLSRAKKHIGAEIGSKALKADGACSIVCAYMAWIVLGSVVLTAWLGWWWIDGAASLALVYFVVKEGMEALQAAKGVPDT